MALADLSREKLMQIFNNEVPLVDRIIDLAGRAEVDPEGVREELREIVGDAIEFIPWDDCQALRDMFGIRGPGFPLDMMEECLQLDKLMPMNWTRRLPTNRRLWPLVAAHVHEKMTRCPAPGPRFPLE